MNNQEKILKKIKKSKSPVFLMQDFSNYSSSNLTKILNKLINEDVIRRVSKGVYVRIRKNRLNNKWMFDHEGGKDGLLIEILNRLNINYNMPQSVSDYLNGKSNQIPANLNIKINNSKRKINLNI